MNLIDENVEKESREKQKRITKLIIITIAALIAILVIILLYSGLKKKNTIKVSVDGKNNTSFSKELFIMADSKNLLTSEKNGDIFISVRELANLLGVEYYNDEFKGKGEDITKCYIKNENEYTSYISNSSKIYKVTDNRTKNNEDRNNRNDLNSSKANNYEYEYFNVAEEVKYINNKIYASEEAIELGFNVNITYSKANKSISIYTLDGLQKIAINKVGSSVVKDNLDYSNKKLLKDGLTLIKNANEEYGITNYVNYQEGNTLLSCKYSNIKFIEGLGCFIVTTSDNNKQGILKIDLDGNYNVKTLLDPKYDEINQLGEDGALYVIKENGKYGIVKITEKDNEVKMDTVLRTEYQTIGIENYEEYENMTTGYLINNKYIPIMAEGKWGLVTTEGKMVIKPQYDVIGCSQTQVGKPVICVPELKNNNDAIIFGTIINDEANHTSTTKYMLVNAEKNTKIGFEATEVYSVDENNQSNYYMKVELGDKSTHILNIYDTYADPPKTNAGVGNTTKSN